MPPLTNGKYEIVAQELASGSGVKDAMVAAGYSQSYGNKLGYRVINRPDIKARIAEILKDREDATLVTVTKMHRRYSDMFDADIADIMLIVECSCDHMQRAKCRKCAGSGLALVGYKPVHLWPKIWRQMLSASDVKEIFERSKDGGNASWDKIGEIVKIKFVQVKDLGDLLGRLKPVDAFVQQKNEDHLHVHLHEEINKRIAAGRQRAAQRNAKSRETTTVAG